MPVPAPPYRPPRTGCHPFLVFLRCTLPRPMQWGGTFSSFTQHKEGTMRNHKDMTAKEAVRAAKEESGLTTEQIARRLNVSTAVIKRYLKEDAAYFPRLDILPRLCLALGNTLLLDWAAAQLGQEFGDRREEMLLLLENAIAVLEEMRFFIRKTETLTCREGEEIHAALDEAGIECDRVRDFLPRRNGCGTKKGIWCPLRTFWQHCLRRTPNR